MAISRQEAIEKLWRMGNLEYFLKGKQKEVKDYLKNNEDEISVVLCTRRFGKSTLLCLWASEECLKNEGCIVKYACPEQVMVEKNINPTFEMIFRDAPDDLKPKWMEAKKTWLFQNGSQIQIAGTEKGNVEKLRGGAAQLCICDEAGYMDDLSYIVNSVMAPMTDTVGGKIVLASTPNYKNVDHEFHTMFIAPRMENESLVRYTIHDSPFYTEQLLEKILKRYPLGADDPKFKCEYLCEIQIYSESSVFPEFTEELQKEIVAEAPIPKFYDAYVSGDPAVNDLTGILYSYYDYDRKKLVILDESVLGGIGETDITTKEIADEIKNKEDMHFKNHITGELNKPELRIMDNSHKILINDLNFEHGLPFIPTQKDNKEAQVDKLRRLIRDGHIEINPRCITLIHHMRTAKWKYKNTAHGKKVDGFQRIKATNDGKFKAHHADLVDALVYLVRNIDFSKNPYRKKVEIYADNTFVPKNSQKNSVLNEFKKIFNMD